MSFLSDMEEASSDREVPGGSLQAFVLPEVCLASMEWCAHECPERRRTRSFAKTLGLKTCKASQDRRSQHPQDLMELKTSFIFMLGISHDTPLDLRRF